MNLVFQILEWTFRSSLALYPDTAGYLYRGIPDAPLQVDEGQGSLVTNPRSNYPLSIFVRDPASGKLGGAISTRSGRSAALYAMRKPYTRLDLRMGEHSNTVSELCRKPIIDAKLHFLGAFRWRLVPIGSPFHLLGDYRCYFRVSVTIPARGVPSCRPPDLPVSWRQPPRIR